MTSYFVIVGHQDNPIFELDLSRTQDSGGANESRRHLNQFVAHASLDLVDEAKWQSGALYLKTVDRFNELIVTAFVTASQMRFLLVHDSSVRGQESIRAFFNDVYELFIKAILNPFYVPNTYIVSNNFKKKVQIVAKKHGVAL
ncbi:PREDICTED: trafficking protein particle complex subunit 2-like [Amphimedon queenslandica]|uniref:Trafficking protein particle complex subunit n=1 Tax=Amphimedon queenslandica TaxID=400682 RepID=A0A1X7VV22_AMPQE|nr:PREDICTED: trafficking protein particle complex subunit 2-like [Amphimedon queenslandica]|eukprot:XP_003382487.1 PREDICTED: trafficking protein particle complex subunit 2-like [Amphimedon queenslandica]